MLTFNESGLNTSGARGDKSKRKNRRGKSILYFFLVSIPVCAYAAKYTVFAIGNQGTLGIMALFLLPIICIPIGAAIVFEMVSIIYALFSKDVLPALIFIPLFLMAIAFPLLPLPPSDTEQHFYDHRTEYEAVVQSAKQGSLSKNAPFQAHITKLKPLVILFNPYNDFYTYIAYAQKREDLDNTDACYYDGGIHSQIGDTWWVCFREWN